MKPQRAPVMFVSHGAGPFAIARAWHQKGLIDLCEKTGSVLDGCKGVIVVTAHWLTAKPHVSSSDSPHIWYDFEDIPGKPFPKEVWNLKYPARGSSDMASQIQQQLKQRGSDCVLDNERGWDHGVWTPMILLRPQADLPIVQVSIPDGPDPIKDAITLGQALEPLRDQGWAILGSGHTYHNFAELIGPILELPGTKNPAPNEPFERRLEEVSTMTDTEARLEAVRNWRSFPGNKEAHPIGSDEHFTPFIVSLAAAGADPGKKLGDWELFGTKSSSYRWG